MNIGDIRELQARYRAFFRMDLFQYISDHWDEELENQTFSYLNCLIDREEYRNYLYQREDFPIEDLTVAWLNQKCHDFGLRDCKRAPYDFKLNYLRGQNDKKRSTSDKRD